MNTIQLFGIPSKLLFSKVEHTYKDMFPIFPPSHLLKSWYCYHQKQLTNPNECYRSWSDMFGYGTTWIVHDKECNNSHHSRTYRSYWCKREMHINKWLHSPCYKNVFYKNFFDFLCYGQYSPSWMVPFNSHDVYFLYLLKTCVHNPPMCASHYNFSTCCHTWETFLGESTLRCYTLDVWEFIFHNF